ncbi:MAG: InlB B-repeat-containing protein [Gemmiger sp.]
MQKTNFKTRLLALLTAAFMLVMCVPFAAFADAAEVSVSFNRLVSDPNPNPYLTQVLTEANPEVVAPALPEGYNAWTSDSTSKVLKAGDKLTYADVKNTNGYVSFNATNVEEEKPEVKKEVTVNINLSDPEAGYFTDNKEAKTLTYEHLAAEGKIEGLKNMVTANEGYEFTGWTWEGNGKGTLDVNAIDFMYTDSAFYNGDSTTGYVTLTAQFKKVEQPETQKHHFTVNFTVDPEKGSFTGIGAGPVVFQGYEEEVGDQQYEVPAVTAKEGYKFVGWKGQGASEIAWNADAKTFGISGLCFYQDGSYEGNASIEAVFEEVKQPETPKHHFTVNFTVDPEKGSFTGIGAGPVVFQGYEEEVGDQQYDVPAVTAKEGYKFVGWKGQGASEIAWDADAKSFGVSGLCFYQNGSNDGYASIEAVFEPTVKLTDIKVNFLKEDGTTVVSAAQYIAKDATLVLPYDVKGVIGWKLANNLTTYDVKTKFSFDDLAAFVGTNYAADGTANLTFYAQYKTEVELKNITIKYVEDKDGAQEDVAAPQNNFTAKDEFTILTDNLYDGKVPAGKKLIGWQYKNGGNTTNFVKGEHVKFDTLKALLNGNWDNEGNAWVTLTPVFQDVKSNNSSSSSASSSSNKTTTASNEKQVVKAAAAPANTTKVLPKTGASNVAPLLGGSLAVVALLMGYGVYSLVLRKKD